jgi:hypothetical protein
MGHVDVFMQMMWDYVKLHSANKFSLICASAV